MIFFFFFPTRRKTFARVLFSLLFFEKRPVPFYGFFFFF